MVRAPCCEKMGVKKGTWSPEEDQKLVSYIKRHGHDNWRALPKQAGLLRCGKSCRLRWTNYLRPDIKRGNFTKEEEDTIIKMHEMLGNRWSAIAARLPGRTDNEIKNVWHTHLKKRLKQNAVNINNRKSPITIAHDGKVHVKPESNLPNFSTHHTFEDAGNVLSSPPQHSSSDVSSSALTDSLSGATVEHEIGNIGFKDLEENPWQEAMSTEKPEYEMADQYIETNTSEQKPQFQFLPLDEPALIDESMDFWLNLYMSGDWPELPDLSLV